MQSKTKTVQQLTVRRYCVFHFNSFHLNLFNRGSLSILHCFSWGRETIYNDKIYNKKP